jgi:hypothetical protein
MRLQPIKASEPGASQAKQPAHDRRLLISAEDSVESISDAFFAVGRDWRFLYVNPQAEWLGTGEGQKRVGRCGYQSSPGEAS